MDWDALGSADRGQIHQDSCRLPINKSPPRIPSFQSWEIWSNLKKNRHQTQRNPWNGIFQPLKGQGTCVYMSRGDCRSIKCYAHVEATSHPCLFKLCNWYRSSLAYMEQDCATKDINLSVGAQLESINHPKRFSEIGIPKERVKCRRSQSSLGRRDPATFRLTVPSHPRWLFSHPD